MALIERVGLASRQTRMLLVKAGLNEDEADAFIDFLRKEFLSGDAHDSNQSLVAIEKSLNNIEALFRSGSKLPTKLRRVIYDIIIGVAAGATWDLLKAEWSKSASSEDNLTYEHFPDEFLIDWIEHSSAEDFLNMEPTFQRALEIRQGSLGRMHHLTAVSIDALSVCLQAKGQLQQAISCRERVVAIERKRLVRHPANLGTALTNLGVSLAAQGRVVAAESRLKAGLRLILDTRGTQHICTAAAGHNWLLIAKRLRLLETSDWTSKQLQAEQDLKQAAIHMMRRKFILITFDAIKVLLENLKLASRL